MSFQYDVVILGCGEAGIFAAYELARLHPELKLLALELRIPVIAAAQVNRLSTVGMNRPPALSELRESGSIEQDADIVIFLYRDDYYNENTEKPGVCEVHLAKHRSGSTDRIELTWVGRYTKFSDKAF